MKVIWKYRLPIQEVATVVIPENAQIIRIDGETTGPDAGQISIWAIVDPEAPKVNRVFHLFKTGGEMPDNINTAVYLGCGAIYIQMELMMYVFEFPNSTSPYVEPAPFDWKTVAEKS